MKKQLISAAALAMLTTTAVAADLPSRQLPVYTAPAALPVFSWTGFYGGVNAGYAFDERRSRTFDVASGAITDNVGGFTGPGAENGVLTRYPRGSRDAFSGGGQIGYNYALAGNSTFGAFRGPLSALVLGITADAQYVGFARNGGPTTDYTFAPTNGTAANNGAAFTSAPGVAPPTLVVKRNRLDYFGTVRGRLGFAIDRILAYGTGGFAYGNTGTGYTVGGGLEYGVTNHVTIGVEYLYVNLDRGSTATTGFYSRASNSTTIFSRGGRENFSLIRATLNYHFSTPTPVVARY